MLKITLKLDQSNINTWNSAQIILRKSRRGIKTYNNLKKINPLISDKIKVEINLGIEKKFALKKAIINSEKW